MPVTSPPKPPSPAALGPPVSPAAPPVPPRPLPLLPPLLGVPASPPPGLSPAAPPSKSGAMTCFLVSLLHAEKPTGETHKANTNGVHLCQRFALIHPRLPASAHAVNAYTHSNMPSDWNPGLYLRYADERTRAAHDLLARVPLAEAANVVDLGCGPGNSTELLVARFPTARLLGMDSSPAMVEEARQRLPQCRFELGDVSTWQPHAAPNVLFANALLQWVPGHEALFPRLLSLLAPGGVLAVQMPDNLEEPSHRLMREVAASGPWASSIGDAARLRAPILSVERYYDLLAPAAAHVDIWRTAYQHRMASPAAIVTWLRATGLRPFLQPLNDELRAGFLAEYEQRLALAYPARADGQLLFSFPRLFVVAQRA